MCQFYFAGCFFKTGLGIDVLAIKTNVGKVFQRHLFIRRLLDLSKLNNKHVVQGRCYCKS